MTWQRSRVGWQSLCLGGITQRMPYGDAQRRHAVRPPGVEAHDHRARNLRAVDGDHAHADQPRLGAEREDLAEQPGQRSLVALAKALCGAPRGH